MITDHLNAFIEIGRWSRGYESQDWAEMLQRMVGGVNRKLYQKFLIQKQGEEAGIKSCILKVSMNLHMVG